MITNNTVKYVSYAHFVGSIVENGADRRWSSMTMMKNVKVALRVLIVPFDLLSSFAVFKE
jgi:hypothetical protein